MTKIRLPYIHEFIDRHGKIRRYARFPGRKRVPLKGPPGSEEFMSAYKAALSGPQQREIGTGRTVPGTINAAVINYFNSTAFQKLAPESRRTRRNILERFRAEHGDKRVALLQAAHIDRMIAAKADTPAAARNFRSALLVLMDQCVLEGWRVDNPARRIKLPPLKSGGYRTWTEDDIAAYRAAHPLGTRARLALELALNLPLRRSDLIRLGRQHVHDGVVQIRTQKTGVRLTIPVNVDLAEAISAMPIPNNLTLLAKSTGKAMTPGGFANWFREMCKEAGLVALSVHGLRKAACRRLAEAGCSANVIQAISGHASLREVQRYVEAADQARLARSGIDIVATTFPSVRTSRGKPE
jgi:integrase